MLCGYRRPKKLSGHYTFGTQTVVEEQVAMFDLMKLMRHRDIKTTLKYYLHLEAQTITGSIRQRKADRRGESVNTPDNEVAENGTSIEVS